MKTPAERQKAVRDRRNAAGKLRRLNMWVSNEAYDALATLARSRGQTRMAVLDQLLMDATQPDVVTDLMDRVTDALSAPLPAYVTAPLATEPSFEPEAPAPKKGSKKAAGTPRRAPRKKPRAQVQIDLFAAQGADKTAPAPRSNTPLPGQASLWDDL